MRNEAIRHSHIAKDISSFLRESNR